MSVSAQFTDFVEQSPVPPPCEPAAIASRLSGQLVEQPIPSAHTPAFRFIEFQTAGEQGSRDFSLSEWATQLGNERRAVVCALDMEIQVFEALHHGAFQSFHKKGRHLVVSRQPALDELEQVYVFDDRSAAAAFIQRSRIRGLLLEAREPLNAAFGEAAVKSLTLVEDDEGFTTMFCLILFPGDMLTARLALRSFDERWWLARSGQAGGKLNFDFELI